MMCITVTLCFIALTIVGLINIIGAPQLSAKKPDKPQFSVESFRKQGLFIIGLGVVFWILVAVFCLISDLPFFEISSIDSGVFAQTVINILIGTAIGLVCATIVTVICILKNKVSWSKDKGIIILFVAGFLLIGMIGGALAGNIDSPEHTKDIFGHDEAEAYVIAKNEVEKNLKSPSTAEFCSINEATITCEENTWTVSGWVDAQNSFGAMLRNEYTVKFTFTSSNIYEIEYCDIN